MSSDASPPDVRTTSLVASVVVLVPAWRVDRPFDYEVPARLSGRVRQGCLVRVPFGRRRVRGLVVSLGHRPPERRLEAVAGVVLAQQLVGPALSELWEWLALRYCAPRGVTYARAVPPRVRVEADGAAPAAARRGGERLRAYEDGAALIAAIGSGVAETWCLRTVAGEDRGALVTELVAAAGSVGGTSLVSVPEVRHGSTVLDDLARRWPELARVDSARPERERAASWLRLAEGHALGGGGRAAVLAPTPSLRLLVIDEEHHGSFKEDRAPRFDARRVALERARIQHAVCVLVSATPSVETGEAAAAGRIRAAFPARAAERAARPIVELVQPERDRVLSAELHRRVAGTIARGGRVALVAARRGYARALWCSSCRRSLRCPACEAGLAYDRAPGGGPSRIRCVRCGHAGTPPEACPTCGAVAWRYLGTGSERLVEQVRKAWPRARVARTDPDVGIAGDGAGDPDIYVTTWVGTKEVLRPPVSLVGVLDADALIRRPDFRASERAYHALAEMAEWAGPASAGGRLLVQSSEPVHHSIQAVVRADYGFFLRRELEQRSELSYPPFAELVELRASGPRRDDVMREAVAACRDVGARVLGPVPTITSAEELQALAKCEDAAVVAKKLRGILAAAPSGTRLRVDIDPR